MRDAPVLMRSVSGIRGVVGNGLGPVELVRYLNAFLQITGARRVVIGRDTRPSGRVLEDMAVAACRLAGADAVRLGMASTPTVEMAVREAGADAGVILTASHNPIEWNALKFLDSEGCFLVEDEVRRLFALVDDDRMTWADHRGIGGAIDHKGAEDLHLRRILELPIVNVRRIRRRKFRVAYDAVNGAGCRIVPKLLRRLGCEVFAIYAEPTGEFPHPPEPTPANLRDLCRLVREKNCDVGVATDPDADRCALVSEKGNALGEEYTLALAAALVLSRNPGPVTINLSTSRMLEDLAGAHGVPLVRTKVGEINVSDAMRKNGSVIGGEGNGGVILPDLHYGRDGVLAVALVLEWMAERNRKLSGLAGELPRYHMEKLKFDLDSKPVENILGRLLAKFEDVPRDEQDGYRFYWPDRWVHVRASNTEPVLRVIAEAPTRKEARSLCDAVKTEIRDN